MFSQAFISLLTTSIYAQNLTDDHQLHVFPSFRYSLPISHHFILHCATNHMFSQTFVAHYTVQTN